MKIEVSMTSDHMFEVNHWWAKKPEYLIETLRSQLEASQALWPELQGYEITKRGGSARSRLKKPEPASNNAAAAE